MFFLSLLYLSGLFWRIFWTVFVIGLDFLHEANIFVHSHVDKSIKNSRTDQKYLINFQLIGVNYGQSCDKSK